MNWNWEPRSWKKSTRVLLGILTIWPIVYLGLFMVSIFSFMLILPFAEKGSSRSCGSLDLIQLDRKIKNGEIKQLTVRPNEIAARERNGDCEFAVTVTSESTRQELLTEARKIVNGQPRVEKIEEESARRDELPWFAPVGFIAFFAVHMLTIFLLFLLMPLYIILAVKNDTLDQTMRIVWVVLFCTMGMLVNPVYWYLYIWRKPPAAPITDNAPQTLSNDIPTVS